MFHLTASWQAQATSHAGCRSARKQVSSELCPVFLVFAALITFRGFRNSVLLSDQVIELRGLSGTRALPLDKIRGRRRYLSRGDEDSPDVWHLVFEPNDDRFAKLDIEKLYRFDDRFYSWFTSLPDLDELDKTRPRTSNFGLV
jgi:hypothetical protein